MSSSRSSKNKDVSFMPKDVKIPKPPKQPEKPLFPYMRYSRRVWDSVKQANPEMKMWDIGKRVGEQWRALSEEERQGYFDEYEVEKIDFVEALKIYHGSQAYRDWLKAKEKAQNEIQEKQLAEKSSGSTIPKEEPRFQLQQMDEEDEEDSFSTKHIATARFQRNHRLINEIFGESAVPDIKTIVTKPRLENLKRQVQSLMQHQRKLESEIVEMKDRFAAKKRRIIEQSERFTDEIAKLSKPSTPASSPLKDKVTSKKKPSENKCDESIRDDHEPSQAETGDEVDMNVVRKEAMNGEVGESDDMKEISSKTTLALHKEGIPVAEPSAEPTDVVMGSSSNSTESEKSYHDEKKNDESGATNKIDDVIKSGLCGISSLPQATGNVPFNPMDGFKVRM